MNLRTRKNHWTTTFAAVALTGILAMGGWTSAQPASGGGMGSGRTGTVLDEPIIDVNFKGGSGSSFINLIRDLYPEVNIVVTGPLDRVSVPEMRLQRVPVGSALEILDNLDQQPQLQNDINLGEISVAIVRPPREATINGAQNVYMILVEEGHDDTVELVASTWIWSLEDLAELGLGQEDLLSAIEAALDLEPDISTPAEIRYHEGTSLLMARGPQAQMIAIDEVMSKARETAQQRMMERRASEARQAQDRAMMEELEERSRRLEEATVDVARWREQVEVMRDQLAEAEARINAIVQENEQIRLEYERRVEMLSRENEELRDQLREKGDR